MRNCCPELLLDFTQENVLGLLQLCSNAARDMPAPLESCFNRLSYGIVRWAAEASWLSGHVPLGVSRGRGSFRGRLHYTKSYLQKLVASTGSKFAVKSRNRRTSSSRPVPPYHHSFGRTISPRHQNLGLVTRSDLAELMGITYRVDQINVSYTGLAQYLVPRCGPLPPPWGTRSLWFCSAHEWCLGCL